MISLVTNVPSKKIGKKDIVRVEGKNLDPADVTKKIARIAPKG